MGKGRRGMESCCKLLGVGSFVQHSTRVRIVRSQVPLNLHQNKCYSLSCNFLYKGIILLKVMDKKGKGRHLILPPSLLVAFNKSISKTMSPLMLFIQGPKA